MRIYFIRFNYLLTLLALCCLSVQFIPAQKPTAKEFSAKADEYLKAAGKFDQFSGSILIAKNGSPIFSKGYGMANYQLNVPNTPKTVFMIASISKQFTSMAIMQLQERGKLNINDPLCKYFEDCPSVWKPITLRHLLTHTSGIPNYSSLPDWDEKISKQSFTQPEFVKVFRDLPLQFTPGENYKYSNSGYYLLGLIIEKISGKSYPDFLKENIFVPVGMKNTDLYDPRPLIPNMAAGYYWSLNSYINPIYQNTKNYFSSGGLISTTEDLLRWDQALYTEKLVSSKSLKEIFTPNKKDYGYGWIINKKFERPTISHSGSNYGFSSFILRFPEERVTIIILSNSDEASATKVANDLAAIVFNETYKLPIPKISDVMAATILAKGIKPALQQFQELRKTQSNKYDFREPMLDNLGWDLIENNRIVDAIEILKLNAENFPNSANAYDSLGEAYLINKNYELALARFKRFLELDPSSTHAQELIKRTEELMKK